jgi:hypothetical protein
MSNNPDKYKKNENCCSWLITYFERHMAFLKADDHLSVQAKLDFLQTYIIMFKNK